MFRDDSRHAVYQQLRDRDLRAFSSYLTIDLFVEAARRARMRICTCPLNCITLVWLGLSSAWRTEESFVTILSSTLKLLQDHEHFHSDKFSKELKRNKDRAKKKKKGNKHNPYGTDGNQVTEEAFAKARKNLPLDFWLALLLLLVERFEAEHRNSMRFRQFRLLAIDGTRLALPNEKPLRDFYGTAKNGSGQHTAQAQMVLLQSPLTRLPVAYQLDSLKVGEVTMARKLSSHLRNDDLVLLDAGYCSYGLMWDIQNRGASFCMRVRFGLNLRTQRCLQGQDDKLVRWTPKDSRGQWRKEGLSRSINLRLIQYRIPGFQTIKLLTNVLSPQVLSFDDFSRLTTNPDVARKLMPGVYHLRWQIETTYREMKVVQQMEGGLRSKIPASIAYEVAGHVLLYLLIRWTMVEAAEKYGLDPLRISFQNAVRELMLIWPTMVVSSPEWVEKTLWPRLLERIAAVTVPLRPGRSYPRNKKKKSKKSRCKAKKS
jgi:hypothetical protein